MSWGRLGGTFDRVRSVIGYDDTTNGQTTTTERNRATATEIAAGEGTPPAQINEEEPLETLEPTDSDLESLLGDVSDVSTTADEAGGTTSDPSSDDEEIVEALDEAFVDLEWMVGQETADPTDGLEVSPEETRFEWVDPTSLEAVDGQ
ncbi:hypothetical protein [Natronosalvus vescus]|uniref:hypothetical protein n=1 Tax=Natronosalvus vescus TaxID=2953881 RepID=UPI002091148F|nr:hypothetical protein [Natronosalvus vescus]